MRSSTILDSAHFQLTPTRTRCDLVISANGKIEKIATGLLNPFLAHLKTAQEQIAKGGYSIILEPVPGSDAAWFTKDTVERFVRFVSTPEILERVYTIESEILQIEKAITIESNNNKVEDQQPKLLESIIEKDKGRKPVPDANEEKAIVLYKPDEQLLDANSQKPHEENSKVQLVRVLETRKAMLQKEQGMAFARAVAAGFDIDRMAPLMSFSLCFGASRLLDASKRFIELWKRKHETGQWLEIEAADAMASRSDFASMNSSGIILSSDINHGELNLEENGKAINEARGDEKHSMGQQVPAGPQDFMHGHFPNPMYPPWPMQSSPGAPPIYHAYPVQGMPYYQNYPGYGPFFQPPYPSPEESRSGSGKRWSQRRRSMDSKDENIESKDDSESDEEASQNSDLKKASRSGKKIVIRNINYITSNRKNASGDESGMDLESDEESGELQTDASDMKLKSSSGSFRGKGSQSKSVGEDALDGKQADNGQWQAFQNFLLRDADEDKHAVDQGMFVMEKGVKIKQRQYMEDGDPLASGGRNPTEIGEAADFNTIGGNVARMKRGVKDDLFKGHSGGGTEYGNEHSNVLFVEEGGRMVGYRRTGNDDVMIRGRNQTTDTMSFSSDLLAGNVFDQATGKFNSNSSQKIGDESFIVPFRSISLDEHGAADREALDMESELPTSVQMVHNNRNGRQVNYEPNDLGMLPERGTEWESTGYDPALDYEMQLHAVNKKLEVAPDNNQGSESLDKNRKSKDTLDKKKGLGPVRKGKPSKPSPLDDARARAEKLRSYKADLQKMKKEKEEEASKRIEALKIERQKRIAARSGANPAQSPLPPQNTRKSLPTKISPSSHKGSKFSDSAPGLSSPLQRSSIRTASIASSGSKQMSKSRSSIGTHSAGNMLTHSASSLPELTENTGVTPESKASMERIRRLSEPKVSSSYHIPPVKKQNTKATPVKTSKVTSDGPESKKISAIINLDKTKAATLPELKIRTSKGPSHSQNTAGKVIIHKANGSKSTVPSEPSQNKNLVPQKSDEDGNSIIEKTVVMFEPEKPSTSKEHILDDRMGESNGYNSNHKKGDEPEVSNYAAIHAPVSQPAVYKVDGEPTKCQLREHDNTHEVLKGAKELPNSSSTIGVEKPYHAPYARVSSLEDLSTKNSEYGKAPPTSLEMQMEGPETVKTHIANFNHMKLEKVTEALEKPQKESSKGFKRLLKFGRKNQSSAAGERESDTMGANEVDDSAANSALSSDVHTLKNLISRDETPTGSNTPQKSSRHFSLLSPFRSKNSEKKVTS